MTLEYIIYFIIAFISFTFFYTSLLESIEKEDLIKKFKTEYKILKEYYKEKIK